MRLLAFLRGAMHHQSKISSQDADAACGIIKYISAFTSHHDTTPCRPSQTPKDGDHAGRWDGTCMSRAFELVICKPWAMTPRGHFSNVGREPTELFIFRFSPGVIVRRAFCAHFHLISSVLHAPRGWLRARRVGREDRGLAVLSWFGWCVAFKKLQCTGQVGRRAEQHHLRVE